MSNNETIFVSIACLADPDVVDTVRDIFEKAKNPQRVTVGLCLQAAPDDSSYDSLNEFDRLRIDRIDAEDSLGPIYARARCERLLEEEDYYLQIDCHSRFFQDWDEKLITEFRLSQSLSPKCVLSHYPININNMNKDDYLGSIGQVNRYRHVDTDALKSHGSLVKMPTKPLPSIGISAAMLFMEGAAKKLIPFDPYLHFGLHAAEQVLYAIRLWTHGYDIYCPTQHTVATEYEGARDRIPDHVKQITSRNRGNWPDRTWSKVKYLLGLDSVGQVDNVYYDDVADDSFPYGLGTNRSLLEYYKLAGLHEQLKELFPNYIYRDS